MGKGYYRHSNNFSRPYKIYTLSNKHYMYFFESYHTIILMKVSTKCSHQLFTNDQNKGYAIGDIITEFFSELVICNVTMKKNGMDDCDRADDYIQQFCDERYK